MIDRNNNLNLIRLLAALQVAYMHAIYHLDLWPGPPLFFAIMQSFNGVVVFFIISGFLVTESYLRSANPADYALKRIVRIYPALIVNIAVLEALVFLTGGFAKDLSFFSYMKFFAMYASTGSQEWAGSLADAPYAGFGLFDAYPSGVLWTLTVELMFYLLLPLLLGLWRRSPAAGTVCLVILTVASFRLSRSFNLSSEKWNTFVSLSIGPYFWLFSCGVAARLAWPRARSMLEGLGFWWLALHIGVAILFFYDHRTNAIKIELPHIFDILRLILLTLVVLSAGFTMPRPNVLRGYDISYGAYLYHMLVIHTLFSLGCVGRLRWWPVVFIATCATALVSWVLIERPASRAMRRSDVLALRRGGAGRVAGQPGGGLA